MHFIIIISVAGGSGGTGRVEHYEGGLTDRLTDCRCCCCWRGPLWKIISNGAVTKAGGERQGRRAQLLNEPAARLHRTVVNVHGGVRTGRQLVGHMGCGVGLTGGIVGGFEPGGGQSVGHMGDVICAVRHSGEIVGGARVAGSKTCLQSSPSNQKYCGNLHRG